MPIHQVLEAFLQTNIHQNKHYNWDDIVAHDSKIRTNKIYFRYELGDGLYVASAKIYNDFDQDWLTLKMTCRGYHLDLERNPHPHPHPHPTCC